MQRQAKVSLLVKSAKAAVWLTCRKTFLRIMQALMQELQQSASKANRRTASIAAPFATGGS